jgi:hypothetical protein
MAKLDFYVAQRMQLPLLALREFPEEVIDIWRKDTLEAFGQQVAEEYLYQELKESKS